MSKENKILKENQSNTVGIIKGSDWRKINNSRL